MGVINYDRSELNTHAQTGWNDGQTLANIAFGVNELSGEADSRVKPLPIDTVGGSGKTDNSGTESMKKEMGYFIETMNLIVLEFSDACGVLGSGSAETLSNADSTESVITQDFEFLTSSVEVDS
ncbi:hypothetical protein [Flaviflexus massiliensis]|uniref:hypothetical protein n=1 Tax=Flaviflexus massiliensis TaxID=1522309 RepID=UPI0006D53A06|nr:hypothetical protein [Flaviflexus massiliensis]